MQTSSPLPTTISLPAGRTEKSSPTKPQYLIYFLPGNPGVVSFYQKFLSQLSEALKKSKTAKGVEIFGTSLAGFECDAAVTAQHARQLPVDIDGQIAFAEEELSAYAKSYINNDLQNPVRVILVAHSLGAYLAMEILQHYRDSLRATDVPNRKYRLVSAIGVFPALVHLAKGTIPARLAWLDSVPMAVLLISTLVRWLCLLIPAFLLHFMIATATGYPAEDADMAVRWLRSRWGFQETLYLAKEEMKRIADDTWDDELWGAPHPTPVAEPRPQLFFLFGEHDGWIPSGPRDDLIAIRGRPTRTTVAANEFRATIDIDRTGIPHDFGVKHSKPVAIKVAEWISQTIENEDKAK